MRYGCRLFGLLLTLVVVLSIVACGTARDRPVVTATREPDATKAPITTDPVQAARSRATTRKRAAARAVRRFYFAVDEKDFSSAWAELSPSLQRYFGGFAAWRAGYATTRSTTLSSARVEAPDRAHATVAVEVQSVDRDACGDTVRQRFAGDWYLSRTQGRWRATSIRVKKTSGSTVRTDSADCPSAVESIEGSTAAGHDDAVEPIKDNASAADPDVVVGTPRDGASGIGKVCYPEVELPAVRLDAVRLPAVRVPAVTVGETHIPARIVPARTIPGRTIPARTIPGRCVVAPKVFELRRTSVRISGYDKLDGEYSPTLSERLWNSSSAVSAPNYTASGFGEFNAAGFPKNQYVRPYVRRDGTLVSGYWRNSPTDGLPTCRLVSC